MIHEDITKTIIRCAMNVHNALGSGFQEVIYQRALEIEFEIAALPYEREKEMTIRYHNRSIGNRRVDFLVQGCVMVELKALIDLEDVHLAQAKNYLEAYNTEIGLLLNFGARSLQFKRLYNNELIQKGKH